MERYVRRWWFLFGVALFLLVPLDLFTTLLAVTKYGTVVEANPVMQWLLHQGLGAVMTANLLVVVVVVPLFHTAIGLVKQAGPERRRTLSRVVNVWIGILLVSGVALVTNNILAVLGTV